MNAGLGRKSVQTLAIDRQKPATVYVGTVGVGVFKSMDAVAAAGERSTWVWTSVYALAIDPQRPATVYAGTSEGVLKSTDGGAGVP